MARRSYLASLLLCILFMVPSLWADVTGGVSGFVRDATGAAVPNAPVTITEVTTNETHRTTSGADGRYTFLDLVPGRYKIVVSATGFKAASIDNIDLKVNDELRFDVALAVGGVDQTVSVEANALQVQTANTSLGGTVESKEMLALPLNGRSYLDLLGLQAGVAPRSTVAATDRPVDGSVLAGGNVSVNGMPEYANAFLVNGGDVSETKNNGAGLIPNIDSIAEFRLITNGYSAEYGKFTGAITNTITKSGSNSLHGDAFEFYRNDAMDARGYFDPTKAALKRHQFGYAVGGPIWRDRLFWFSDYQGTLQTSGASTGLQNVASNAQRGGTFSPAAFGTKTVTGTYWAQVLSNRLGYTVTNGELYSSPTCVNNTQCVFPNGVIPTAGFDVAAVDELQFVPVANQPNGTQYANSSLNNSITDNKIGERIDLQNHRTGNWSFYYHYDNTAALNQFAAGFVPGFATTEPSRAQMFMMSNTRPIGPSMVNEARATFFRTAVQTAQPVPGAGNNAPVSSFGFVTGTGTLGIIPSGPAGYPQSAPPAAFSNLGISFGNPLTNMHAVDNNYMASDSFSKVVGSQSMVMGGEFRYYQLNVRNVCAPNGTYTFTGGETGNDFADFLVGAPGTYVQCSVQLLDNRARYGALFFQDGWKARPNLTLNMGLRWDIAVPWYDAHSQLNTFIAGEQSQLFPLAPLGYLVPGDPNVPASISPTEWNRFAPRFGLAYSPSASSGLMGKLMGGPGKSSIRGSYGIYYLGASDSNNFGVIGSAPWGLYWTSLAQTMMDTPFQTRATGASQTQRFPFTAPVAGAASNAHLDFSVYEPVVGPGLNTHNELAYAEHYNLSIQRQLTGSTVLTIAYTGTQGHHLQGDLNINPGNQALCLQLSATANLAPGSPACGPNNEKQVFTQSNGNVVYGSLQGMGNQALGKVAFGKVHLYSNISNSNYNGLQMTLEHRARSLSFLTAYTYSKSIDNQNTPFYPSNLRYNRAPSPWDLRHNFVASYSYTLPLNHGSLPKRLTEGWTISGITRFATGFPVTVSQSGDVALTGFAFDFPNALGPVVKQNPRLPANGSIPNHAYILPGAFGKESPGVVGNSGPRPFYGPGLMNTDAGISKNLKINERFSAAFRGEFFNIFNHANFLNPNGNIGSSAFGTVSTASAPRIGQVSVKVLF